MESNDYNIPLSCFILSKCDQECFDESKESGQLPLWNGLTTRDNHLLSCLTQNMVVVGEVNWFWKSRKAISTTSANIGKPQKIILQNQQQLLGWLIFQRGHFLLPSPLPIKFPKQPWSWTIYRDWKMIRLARIQTLGSSPVEDVIGSSSFWSW